ncbi:MAG: 50S ribosomal protein L11 methyltransferase [Gammaproteobacteria bacterium]|nr:50S ribosomal protein L11 methyltransferase [Gammaproteobacteria bacterium]
MPHRLDKNTLLSWAAQFEIRYSRNRMVIGHDGVETPLPTNNLAILQAFSTPRSLSEGLDRLAASNRDDWVTLSADVLRLVELGVLVTEDRSRPVLIAGTSDFGGAASHISMLNDRTRTRTYIEAIRDTVTPGQVVVDLGTGTGVLALSAAKAGARHVYAIEQSRMSNCAANMFERNGCSDRITLLRGRSTDVNLPEPADLLISEIIGTSPFAEGILTYAEDAHRRLLKPGAESIPCRLRIYAQALTVDPPLLAQHRFSAEQTANWADWYGLDFTALLEAVSERPYEFVANASAVRRSQPMTEPVCVTALQFPALETSLVADSVDCMAITDGTITGAVIYFEAWLTEQHRLTNAPTEIDDDSSWQCPVFLLEKPFSVHAGARLQWHLTHGPAGTALGLSALD